MKNEIKNFSSFGVMVDCSRNAVMTVAELKKFITLISRMGYNQVQLYMEDTYEVNDEPYFGYLRGKYTKEELKELDDFADSIFHDEKRANFEANLVGVEYFGEV